MDIGKIFIEFIPLIFSLHSSALSTASSSGNNLTDFPGFHFAQSWPKEICRERREESFSNSTCSLPQHNNWTIHGIWPSYLINETSPHYCSTLPPFDLAILSPIEDQLKIKWPNIGTEDESDCDFWKHEWDKHGTCGLEISDIDSVFKYFQKGLDLANDFDITKISKEADILPGNSYQVQFIIHRISKVVGKKIYVRCVQDKEGKMSYLLEIDICLDRSMELIDCDALGGRLSNCQLETNVMYID